MTPPAASRKRRDTYFGTFELSTSLALLCAFPTSVYMCDFVFVFIFVSFSATISRVFELVHYLAREVDRGAVMYTFTKPIIAFSMERKGSCVGGMVGR